MSQAAPVRVAIVGLDHWYSAFAFARAVSACEETVLVAIADNDLQRARYIADHYGAERATTDRESVAADPGVDLVASFVSSDQNPDVCATMARAGKHLVSVKPAACTLEEAAILGAVVAESGVLFVPSETRVRLSPQHQQIKRWVDEGAFGRVLSVTYHLSGSLPEQWPGDPDPGWWADAARVPGGGWIDHAIYGIDLFRWLFDDEVVSASGVAGNLKYPDLSVDDFGAAVLRFGSGIVANIEVTWTAPAGGGRHALGMVGTEATLAFDTLTGNLSLGGNLSVTGRWEHRTPQQWDDEAIGNLVAAVRGEASPVGTFDDAWHNLATCLAFYEAAASGVARAPVVSPTSIHGFETTGANASGTA